MLGTFGRSSRSKAANGSSPFGSKASSPALLCPESNSPPPSDTLECSGFSVFFGFSEFSGFSRSFELPEPSKPLPASSAWKDPPSDTVFTGSGEEARLFPDPSFRSFGPAPPPLPA